MEEIPRTLMGYSVGYNGHRWIGYGVPAECDVTWCHNDIDRGMGYRCWGGYETEGEAEYWTECENDFFFCEAHARHSDHVDSMVEKGESLEWLEHMMTDESWEKWRQTDPSYSRYQKLYEKKKQGTLP